jgi:hypothetical protein
MPRSRPICPSLPLHPTPKSRARKLRRRHGSSLGVRNLSGLVGHGRRARGGWKNVVWRVHPRPTGKGYPRLPGARPALLPAKHHASPGRSRRVRPFRDRTRPLPPAPAETPPGAAGTCQAGVRGDAASARGPGRPSKPCGSDAAGGTLMRRNRFRPFARDTLAPSTPMGQAPALTGAKLHKLPARRYGSRQPELTASRRPGLRGPRPSVQDGRQDKCGTGREGVEKIVRIFRAMRWGRLETTGEQLMSLRQA